jgi:hypothetical protein
MKTIWKYELRPFTTIQTLEIPGGLPHQFEKLSAYHAKFLHCDTQKDILAQVPCLWFEIDDTQPKEEVKIFIYGTGYILSETDYLVYLGTYLLEEGSLVYRVYYKAD